MTLDQLLSGDEAEISEWLTEQGLLHSCDCGYTVYDPDTVNEAVQDKWGDERCDEIFDWACNLSNRFGWLFIESSIPAHDIYHCQHCADSELSLLNDLQAIASASKSSDDEGQASPALSTTSVVPADRLAVYIDESYTDEYPRKADGFLALAALIVPEDSIRQISDGVNAILRHCYRGRPAVELKHSQIRKYPRLHECVGKRIVELLASVPGCSIVGLCVPRDGFFAEQLRSIKAIAQYDGKIPAANELDSVLAATSIEHAVRNAANSLAQNLAFCVGNHVAARNACATMYFDPRSESIDRELREALTLHLPKTLVNAPFLRHGDKIVTVRPSGDAARLGNRIVCRTDSDSKGTAGIQLADFIAGDIRCFFQENPGFLDAATSSEVILNKRILFPQAFQVSRLDCSLMEILRSRTGKSLLPDYRKLLANGLISYYTRNGQMRNLNTVTGEIYDLVD